MNIKIKVFVLMIVAAAGLVSAKAQDTYSGFFLENYDYRFQMNPAFGNESRFVSLPILGNFNVGMRGNLNLTDVLYKLDGRTVLFTNPGISVDEVMSKFDDKNRLGANVKLNIFSMGFKALGGYNTINLSASTGVNASLPRAFFSMVKEGVTNTSYDISDLRGYADAYAQLALGHSRDIKQVPGLRVGAAVKFLIGIGSIDFRLDRANLTLGHDSWQAVTNANIYASIKGMEFETSVNDKTDHRYVSGGSLDDFSAPNGFGLGFDLGAQYKWREFTFSAALLDFGFISWGNTLWASTDGDQTIDTDAYIFNADGDAANSFSDEWDRLSNDLSRLYELNDKGTLSSRTRMLAATLNFGVDYEFPLYRKLHFGLVNSTVIDGPFTRTQFRISANVAPLNWLSAGINVATGTTGTGMGWLLNFHTTGFNLFIGMDHTVGRLSKQFVPLSSDFDFNFGINFPF